MEDHDVADNAVDEQSMTVTPAPRMLVANTRQQRLLDRVVANVHVGNPQSAKVAAVRDDLSPARRQFDFEPHYLLAAASYLRDKGLLNEGFDLADKLGIATGDAVMVLRPVPGAGQHIAVDQDAFVRDFYEGAESNPSTRSLLLKALEVVREAMTELSDDDALVIFAR